MAVVNPPVQLTNDPSYTRDSRGVNVPDDIKPQGVAQNQIQPKGVDTPDRSAEFLGSAAAYGMEADAVQTKSLGDLFAGVVGLGDFALKGIDTIFKKNIEREVYEVADKERTEYTARLEELLASRGGGRSIFDANAQMQDEDLPGELEDLPDTIGALKASNQAGKISNTYYTGRLLSAAKDLRNRYPGYRAYIDQQFAQVTGMNPANARINALTQEINRSQASSQAQQTMALREVVKRNGYAYGGVNAATALQKVQTGEWGLQDVLRWSAPGDKLESDLKLQKSLMDVQSGNREQDARTAKDAAFTIIAAKTSNLMENIIASVPGATDLDGIRERMKDNTISAEQWRNTVVDLERTKATLRRQLYADLNEGGRNSVATKMGMTPKQVYEYIDENLKEFDDVITSIKDKDGNALAGAANRIKSMTDETVETMMKDSKLAPFARIGAAAKQVFGDNTQISREFTERVLAKNYSGRFDTFLRGYETKLRLGSATGQTTSFNEAFEDMRRKQVLSKTDSSKLVNIVTDIANPKVSDTEKLGIVDSAFSEANRGFISKLQADATDAQGRPVEGQWAVFQKWTTPAIVKEIKRLDTVQPGTWDKFVNWSEQTMASELLGRELQNLNNLDKDVNLNVFWKTSENGIRELAVEPVIKGDGEEYRIQRQMSGVPIPRMNDMTRMVNRINSALNRYSNIAKESGQDADAFILRSLHRAGVVNQGIFSDKLVTAIKNSRIKTEINRQTGNANR